MVKTCFFLKIFDIGVFCCVYLLIVSAKVAAVSIILESFSLSRFFTGEHPGEGCLLYAGCGKVQSDSEGGCCGFLASMMLIFFLIGSTIANILSLVVNSGCCTDVVDCCAVF